MFPSILKQFAFNVGDIIITKPILKYIITSIPEEAGVRNLKRVLADIISTINYSIIIGNNDYSLPYTITDSIVDEHVKNKHEQKTHFIHSMYI
jgi:ATP-dependent Lon protease